MMPPPSSFKIQPDPPVAGQPVDISYEGTSTTIWMQIDGNDPVPLTPKSGKVRVDPVPTGLHFTLTDRRGMPGFLHRYITELE